MTPILATCWLLADGNPTLLERLDGLSRAKVLIALLVLLGLALLIGLVVYLGARFVRSYMRDPEATPPRPREDDWSEKPLP
jgi:hypothetical protein